MILLNCVVRVRALMEGIFDLCNGNDIESLKNLGFLMCDCFLFG